MGPLYISNYRFGPWHGERWRDFITWSGLTQLKELVSLDGHLNGRVLDETKVEYWPHIVNEDFMLDYFTDLEFMLKQIPETTSKNILCVFRNPPLHPEPPKDKFRFEFVGYDLIDVKTEISALSNCRGFSRAFSKLELNGFGLLNTHETAMKIQASLLEQYPNEGHADCHRWAVFRAVGFRRL